MKRGGVKEERTMPHYVFLCQDCSKEFTQILHIADLAKGGVVCPHCGGKRVTQQAGDPKGSGVLRGYLQEKLDCASVPITPCGGFSPTW